MTSFEAERERLRSELARAWGACRDGVKWSATSAPLSASARRAA